MNAGDQRLVIASGRSSGLALPAASRFLHWFTVGLIVPVLNLLLLSRGLDLAGIGLATAIYSGVIVVLELPTGIFADLVGRKRTYLVSLAIAGVGYSALAAAPTALAAAPSATAAATVMALVALGVARAFSSGSIEALFIDRFIAARGAEKLHALTSVLNVAEAAGLALGAFAGGWIPILWESLAPAAGRYGGNAIAQLALTGLQALLVSVGVRADRVRADRVRADGQDGAKGPADPGRPGSPDGRSAGTRGRLASFVRDSTRFVAGNRIVMVLLGAAAAWGLCFSAVELLWQPRLEALLGSADSSWIFGALSSGYFLAAVAGSAVAPFIAGRTRLPVPRLLALLRLLNGVFMALFALQGGVAGFAVLYLAMFSFNGMAGPSESALLNREIPGEKRASILSLASLCLQLGGMTGALAFGLIAAVASIPAALVAAGLVFSLSAALYLLADRPRRGESSGQE